MNRVIGLVITIILILVWFLSRKKETYSDIQITSLGSFFRNRYIGTNGDNIKKYIVKSILSLDIGNDASAGLSNINLLVDTLNSNGYTFTHYTDVNELNTMFDTAYTSGESSLGNRDRIILRAFAWPGIELTRNFSQAVPVNYTNEGIPDFTSTIVSESGKTTKEMLQYCFTFIDKLFSSGNGQNPFTPEVIDYINSTIPSKYTQKYDRTDNTSIMDALNSPTFNETTIWLIKAMLIGPAYIAWLAENKWRLNLTWTP